MGIVMIQNPPLGPHTVFHNALFLTVQNIFVEVSVDHHSQCMIPSVSEDNQHHLQFAAQHSCHFLSVRWAHWPPEASSFRSGVILEYSWLTTSDDTVHNVQFFPIHSTRSVKIVSFLVMHQNSGNHLHIHISDVQFYIIIMPTDSLFIFSTSASL